MTITLMQLPFQPSDLNPFISTETINTHYNKHHAGYVKKLNEIIKETELENKTLEEIINATRGKSDKATIFNNAAQIWNHDFYWNSMKNNAQETSTPELDKLLAKKWGSKDEFTKEYQAKALTLFGSGWVWLVLNKNNELEIVQTSNANIPDSSNFTPILVMDVWEHSYYIDYKNERNTYAKAFSNIINWHFAEQNLANKKN